MDREFEQQNKGDIRTTMLMQDCTFKQQVKELHRLYSVQKSQMDELKQETKQPTPNHQNYLENYDGDQISSRENNGRSCSTDADACRTSAANYFDLDRHARPEDNCSSPMGFGKLSINGGDDESSKVVDLTLSIGFGGNSLSKKFS